MTSNQATADSTFQPDSTIFEGKESPLPCGAEITVKVNKDGLLFIDTTNSDIKHNQDQEQLGRELITALEDKFPDQDLPQWVGYPQLHPKKRDAKRGASEILDNKLPAVLDTPEAEARKAIVYATFKYLHSLPRSDQQSMRPGSREPIDNFHNRRPGRIPLKKGA